MPSLEDEVSLSHPGKPAPMSSGDFMDLSGQVIFPIDFVGTVVRIDMLVKEKLLDQAAMTVFAQTSQNLASALIVTGAMLIPALVNGARSYFNKQQTKANNSPYAIYNMLSSTPESKNKPDISGETKYANDIPSATAESTAEADKYLRQILDSDPTLKNKYKDAHLVRTGANNDELGIRLVPNENRIDSPSKPDTRWEKFVKRSKIFSWDTWDLISYAFWGVFILVLPFTNRFAPAGGVGGGPIASAMGFILPLAVGYIFLSLKIRNWIYNEYPYVREKTIFGKILIQQYKPTSTLGKIFNALFNIVRLPLVVPGALLFVFEYGLRRAFDKDWKDNERRHQKVHQKKIAHKKQHEVHKDAAKLLRGGLMLDRFEIAKRNIQNELAQTRAEKEQLTTQARFERHEQQALDKSKRLNAELESKIQGDSFRNIISKRIYRITQHKYWKIAGTFLNSLVGGWFVPQFVAWIVTDMLKYAGLMPVPIALPIVIGVGVSFFVIAIAFAIYNVIKKVKEMQKYEKMQHEFSSIKYPKEYDRTLVQRMNELKQRLEINKAKIREITAKFPALVKACNKRIAELNQSATKKQNFLSQSRLHASFYLNKFTRVPNADQPQFYKDPEKNGPGFFTRAKKYFARGIMFIAGIESGILLVRFFAMEGQAIFLPYVAFAAIPHVAIGFLAAFIVVGVLYGIFKAIKYHFDHQGGEDELFLGEPYARYENLEKECELSEQVLDQVMVDLDYLGLKQIALEGRPSSDNDSFFDATSDTPPNTPTIVTVELQQIGRRSTVVQQVSARQLQPLPVTPTPAPTKAETKDEKDDGPIPQAPIAVP